MSWPRRILIAAAAPWLFGMDPETYLGIVLRGAATRLAAAHAALAPLITKDLIEEVAGLVPADWLGDGRPGDYVAQLAGRAPNVPGVIRR